MYSLSKQVIAAQKADIEQERKLRDEAMQGKSGLESSLQKKIDQLTNEIVVTQKNADALIEKSKATVGEEAEKGKKLQSDLDRVKKMLNDSLDKADAVKKQHDDTLRTKEDELSELQYKNDQLLRDMEKTQVQSQRDVESKKDEIKDLEDMVSNLTANVEKEIKL